MTCLSSIKFNLVATILRNYKENVYGDDAGSYQDIYDELTGEVRQVWVAADLIPDDGKDANVMEVPCSVAPSYTVSQANDVRYQNGGAKVIDTERLVMKVPSRFHIFNTDRVTSIKDREGILVFEDDQTPKMYNGVWIPNPAIYNITGVTPVMDPFGRIMERQLQLEKTN